MDEKTEDQVRAGYILAGVALGVSGAPLSTAVLTSLLIQSLSWATNPMAHSFAWGVGMVASTSLGWGLSSTLKREVFTRSLEAKSGR